MHRQPGRVLSRAFPGRGWGPFGRLVEWFKLGFGRSFAGAFHRFAIERACKEEHLNFRTYLDGGDYVGAAAAAAGKLCLGHCWKDLVQDSAAFFVFLDVKDN